MRYYGYITFLIIITVSMLSCVKELSLEERIDLSVEEKLVESKKQRVLDCQEEVLELAEMHVDSIMYLEIGTSLQGVIELPDRPMRDEDTTGFEVELDSSPVEGFELDSL